MKQIVLVFTALLLLTGMQAQELKVIKLDAPRKDGGTPVMKVFNNRHSDRVFAADALKPMDLSTLLWAANGINRADGKRTAPSAKDVRDVDVFVILKEGAYIYDPEAHALNPLTAGDHRALVAGGQDFAKTAPVCIVLASELSRLGDPTNENTRLMGAVDVGIVNQNINLACAALGLSTVPRATMDKESLKKVLKLKDSHLLLMNNPVGYPIGEVKYVPVK